jgi:hypothetical protein
MSSSEICSLYANKTIVAILFFEQISTIFRTFMIYLLFLTYKSQLTYPSYFVFTLFDRIKYFLTLTNMDNPVNIYNEIVFFLSSHFLNYQIKLILTVILLILVLIIFLISLVILNVLFIINFITLSV